VLGKLIRSLGHGSLGFLHQLAGSPAVLRPHRSHNSQACERGGYSREALPPFAVWKSGWVMTSLTMLLVLVLVGGLASPPSRAAEFFYMDHDRLTERYVGAVGPLVLSGDIAAGD